MSSTIVDRRGCPDGNAVRRHAVMKGAKAIAADAVCTRQRSGRSTSSRSRVVTSGRRSSPLGNAALLQLVPVDDHVRVPDLWDDGAALFCAVTDLELEGVVGKRVDAPYVAGRSKHWLKCGRPQPGRRNAANRISPGFAAGRCRSCPLPTD